MAPAGVRRRRTAVVTERREFPRRRRRHPPGRAVSRPRCRPVPHLRFHPRCAMKSRAFHPLALVLGALSCMAGFQAGCDSPDEGCTKGYAPSDCISTAPTTGLLTVQVTINGLNSAVPITLYRGTIEQNDVVFRDTLTTTSATYRVPNADYALLATYR